MAKLRWPKVELEFEVPIYGGRVYCTADIESYDSIREYLGVDPVSSDVVGRTTQYTNNITGGTIYVVLVLDGKPSTLVHELGHLTHRILERAGVKDEEAFCYLLDYLFFRCGGDNARYR